MQKYKMRKDGRYKTRVWDGTYKDGEKHYIDVYSTKSSRDLELKVKEIEEKRQHGALTKDAEKDIYLYAIEYINRSKFSVESSTRRIYLSLAEHLKYLQGCTFNNFTYNTVQDLFNSCSATPSVCMHLKMLLNQIGKAAERDRLMPRGTTEDIFRSISVPKYRPKKKEAITEEEKERLLKTPMPLQLKCFVYTLYYAGLRKSEAVCLKVSDVQGGLIYVSKSYGQGVDGSYLKTPKSERGTRRVPIPQNLQAVYDEYLPTIKEKDGYLFSADGSQPWDSSMLLKMWRKMQKLTNTDFSPHYLRHNYCTSLCYQSIKERSISPKKIAELLGDRDDMVMNVYSHIIEEKENTVDAIEKALKF